MTSHPVAVNDSQFPGVTQGRERLGLLHQFYFCAGMRAGFLGAAGRVPCNPPVWGCGERSGAGLYSYRWSGFGTLRNSVHHKRCVVWEGGTQRISSMDLSKEYTHLLSFLQAFKPIL